MTNISWFEDHHWTLVKVRGADRVDFLHRLTTNSLPSAKSPLVHNFFLSVNARIQAEFWVSAQDEYLALLTPRRQENALKESIDRYHFGEKIEVLSAEGHLFVVSGAQSDALPSDGVTIFAPDPRYGEDCLWCHVSAEGREAFLDQLRQWGPEMGELEAERRRISLGTPKLGLDYDEETLFVEVAQKGDFSESKGCYPGQEIVARVLHRGKLNRHLRAFTSEVQIPATWALKVDGKEVAAVRSTVATPEGGSIGYLLVRREYGEVGQSLSAEVSEKTYSLTVVERAGEVLTGVEE